MAVTSASTLAAVEAQFDDNADYDIEGSAAKAKLFIQAGRILLRRYRSSASQRGTTFSRDMGALEAQLDAAVTWYRAKTGSAANGGISLVDLREARW